MASINPETAWEFADAIKSVFKMPTARRRATVQSVDDDGTIWVQLPGSPNVTPIASTGANVEPGDTVLTELRGTSLHITENNTDPAVGARQAGSIAHAAAKPALDAAKEAQAIAGEAEAVANATNQHFWDDTNGAHVTDVTQVEWKAAEADSFSDLSDAKPYHNLLMNSLGILLRRALNNLVSISRSAIAFYDGLGNNAANIVASFGTSGAQVGRSDKAHINITDSALSLSGVGADNDTYTVARLFVEEQPVEEGATIMEQVPVMEIGWNGMQLREKGIYSNDGTASLTVADDGFVMADGSNSLEVGSNAVMMGIGTGQIDFTNRSVALTGPGGHEIHLHSNASGNAGLYDPYHQKWLVRIDDNGAIDYPGLTIGNNTSFEGNMTSVPHGTYRALQSFTLAKGRWLLIIGCYAANNSTGYRSWTLSSASSIDAQSFGHTLGMGAADAAIYSTLTQFVEPSSSTTYRIFGWQNSGGALNMRSTVRAIKLS